MRYPLAALALAVGLSPVQQALAHPHEFVLMRIEPHFDDSGKLASMRYHWKFDEFFSAYALEGEDKNKNGKAEQEELDKLLVEILGNIKGNNYFTKFDMNGLVPTFGKATPISAKMEGRQVAIKFELALETPLDLSGKEVRYGIYDDEFYIAMNHDPDDVPVMLSNAPKGCSWNLDPASPDESTVAYAGSLGKDQSGGSDLGIQFAEWVTLSCK